MKMNLTTRMDARPTEGSALLIVLGFLSFMMISAVSFAVYMRIDRRASANYRHATSARHFLDAALYHAMDEVDAQLRIYQPAESSSMFFPGLLKEGDPSRDLQAYNKIMQNTSNPVGWLGSRFLTSASPYKEDRAGSPRVLSLESLGYLPAYFVNDARRYATSNPENPAFDQDDATEDYMGAKWKPIYCPVYGFDGVNIGTGSNLVGRFAYMCINVSDLLDVNVCRASLQNVSPTNRISIHHLFAGQGGGSAAATAFDDHVKNTDIHYESLMDFYTCMRDWGQDRVFGSPYYEFLDESSRTVNDFNEAAEQKDPTTGNGVGPVHLLITDSLAKPEPTGKRVNLSGLRLKDEYNRLPMTKFRDDGKTLPGLLQSSDQGDEVLEKIGFSMKDENVKLTGRKASCFSACLVDYLDKDVVPQLNMPSVERVPMLSRFVIPDDFKTLSVRIVKEGDGTEEAPWQFFAVVQQESDKVVGVETLYPFLFDDNMATILSQYAVTFQGRFCMSEQDGERDTNLNGNDDDDSPFVLKRTLLSAANLDTGAKMLGNSRNASKYWLVNLRDPIQARNNSRLLIGSFYQSKDGDRQPKPGNIAQCDQKSWNPAAMALIKRYLTLTVAGQVRRRQDSNYSGVQTTDNGYQQGTVVDAVPFSFANWNNNYQEMVALMAGSGNNTLRFRGTIEKTFTEADWTPLLDRAIGGAVPEVKVDINWNWRSLCAADVRLNHRAKNWYQSPDADQERTNAKVKTDLQSLLGKDGRDGDFFLETSDLGYLHSPGEFGYLMRPFAVENGTADQYADPPTSPSQTADAEYMYRTFRIYHHGSASGQKTQADQVYEYFCCDVDLNPDGSIKGGRVNPLSNQRNVLKAAIQAVPVSYRYANDTDMKNSLFYMQPAVARTSDSCFANTETRWNAFQEVWSDRMMASKGYGWSAPKDAPLNVTTRNSQPYTLNNCFHKSFSTLYGSDELFGWYTGVPQSGGIADKLIGQNVELREIESKMLYSWTLDNFSRRQQLFLYVLVAETLGPNAGLTTGVKPLSSARAVALVWRDPFPLDYSYDAQAGYAFGNNPSWSKAQEWYKGGRSQSDDMLEYVSPWFSYEYDGSCYWSSTGTGSKRRTDAYHEQKVLYFRQLSN